MTLTARFAAYAIVGGFCTVLNLGLLWLLTSVLGLHYLLSTMASFLALTPVGFWLQKLLTFRTARRHAMLEWPRYAITMASSFAANLALMYMLVSLLGVWYLAASVVVTIVLLFANFLANYLWSFALRRG